MSNPLINRTAVRELALAILAHERPHLAAKFTQVSSNFLDTVEEKLKAVIVREVMAAPTNGRTLRPQ